MKPIKIGLRIWIALTSVFSFLGGWALLSHAGKPVPLLNNDVNTSAAQPALTNPGAMPTLAPVPSIDNLTRGGNSGLQALPSIQSGSIQQQFLPRMRTRGS